MTKLSMRSIVAVAMSVVLGTLAMAQQPVTIAKTQPTKKEDAKKDDVKKVDSKDPAKADTVVKTFELKNANPNEIQQFLSKHLAAAAAKHGRPPFLVAVDFKNKTVFVRGATADVETAGKVIAQIDGGSSKDGPLNVIVLQYTSIEEAMRILNSLELGGSVHACPASHVLVIPHSATNVDQIKAIVEKLEACNKPKPKTETATSPKNKNN